MVVQAAFLVLLLFAATVKTEEGAVTFWRSTVTLTCPGYGTWYDSKNKTGEGITFEFQYKGQAQYICKYTDEEEKEYYFHVKGKACENCFEVDGLHFMMVIILDVLGTAVLMIIIFKCAKKKFPDGPGPLPRSPAKPRSRGPSAPSSDYESLNRNTLTVDTYSTVVPKTR